MNSRIHSIAKSNSTMAKTLLKVTKKIQKKKGTLHPKGRKAQLLARASLRDDRINKKKLIHSMKKSEDNLIVDFFQEFINSESQLHKKSFELEDMKDLIVTFINRDKDELDKMRAERRSDRPASKKQDLLEFRMKQEQHYFESGWSVVDLRIPDNVLNLRNWNGGHGGLTSIIFCIVKKDGTPEDGKDTEMS